MLFVWSTRVLSNRTFVTVAEPNHHRLLVLNRIVIVEIKNCNRKKQNFLHRPRSSPRNHSPFWSKERKRSKIWKTFFDRDWTIHDLTVLVQIILMSIPTTSVHVVVPTQTVTAPRSSPKRSDIFLGLTTIKNKFQQNSTSCSLLGPRTFVFFQRTNSHILPDLSVVCPRQSGCPRPSFRLKTFVTDKHQCRTRRRNWTPLQTSQEDLGPGDVNH